MLKRQTVPSLEHVIISSIRQKLQLQAIRRLLLPRRLYTQGAISLWRYAACFS